MTSLRFIAVIGIFLHHSDVLFGANQDYMVIYNSLFREGYIAVTFFFILSGFVLTYNYLDKCSINSSWLKYFYVNRLSRILPTHILTFVLAIPFLIISVEFNHLWIGGINLLLLQSLFPSKDIYFSVNSVSWTLSNEIFFYLLFPFLLLIFQRIRNTIITPILVMIVIWGGLFGVAFWQKDNPLAHWIFYIFPGVRIIDFVIGILLCLVFFYIQKMTSIQLSSFVFSALEIFSLIALSLAVSLGNPVHQTLRYDTYYLPFLCLIILIFAIGKGCLSLALSKRALIILGNLSFSFFLLHQLFLRYTAIFILPSKVIHNFGLASDLLILFLVFGATTLVAWFMFNKFEEPCRKSIRALNKSC